MRCHSEEEEKIALLVFPPSSPYERSEGIQALQSHLVTEFVLLLNNNRNNSNNALAVQRQTQLGGDFPVTPALIMQPHHYTVTFITGKHLLIIEKQSHQPSRCQRAPVIFIMLLLQSLLTLDSL